MNDYLMSRFSLDQNCVINEYHINFLAAYVCIKTIKVEFIDFDELQDTK